MAQGICIVAEYQDRVLTPAFAELMTAATEIKSATKEPIQVILAETDCASLISQFGAYPVDEIYMVEIETDGMFLDDMLSEIYAEMLCRIAPSSVLIPASETGRSVFPRVALRLKTGLTADCTGLEACRRPDGAWYIRQTKPSFEAMSMVCLSCKPGIYPQMMTVREGVFEALEPQGGLVLPAPVRLNILPERTSGIEVLEVLPHEAEGDSIRDAEIVVVAGRGALDGGHWELLQKVADKLGAAVGGTRPLADEGRIPFENQIGQTGSTIRPHIILSFGVSGAIQHTEGIKNAKLFLAVNTAEDAPIFGVADYGAIADMGPVLENMLTMLE
jgi:electron transfer flavoprotein alpha subunit